MKKIISFIMVLAMVLSVSSLAMAISVTPADAQSELDNAVSGDVTLDLAAGNYELKFTLGKGTESNVDKDTDYYYRATYTRTHGSLILESSQNATIDGLSLGVATGGHTQLIIDGALTDAVVEQKYDIGILKFTGVVFNDIVDIDLTGDCDIDEIIFENVTFNMTDKDNISEAAVYIHDDSSADSDLPNVTFKNCVFKGCDNLGDPIHIVSQSATDADIIIEDCIIDGTGGFAIMLAGTGPYRGDISITNNKISNTKDRGIRISKTADEANISIEGNTLVNATRANGEVKEAIKIDGTAQISVKNNTLDGEPISESAVVAKDAKAEGKLTITFEEPEITDMSDGGVFTGQKEGLTFRSNADFEKFRGVKVDGNEIAEDKDYTAVEGSTVVTLHADYLKTLAVGEYTIAIVSENGEAEAKFTIKGEEKPASSGTGIKVTYNGGNSFSTTNSEVPSAVEIDGVPVAFTGDGKNFTVGCIAPNANWVTVKWHGTTVTTNFTPDAGVVCTEVAIPKTGDMPVWAAVMAFLGF